MINKDTLHMMNKFIDRQQKINEIYCKLTFLSDT